jgi:hypothetical protein
MYRGLTVLIATLGCIAGATAWINCIVCQGKSNDADCGVSAASQQIVNCSDQCFLQVTAVAGSVPYFQRGCGTVQCSLLPDPSTWGDLCDINGHVNLLSSTKDSSSHIFRSKDVVSGVLQCRDSNLCNRNGSLMNSLPNYYAIRSYYSSASTATVMPCVLFAICAAVIAKLF